MPRWHHASFIKHLINFFNKVSENYGDCHDWNVSFSNGKYHLSAAWKCGARDTVSLVSHLSKFFVKVRGHCGDCHEWNVGFSSGKCHLSASWVLGALDTTDENGSHVTETRQIKVTGGNSKSTPRGDNNDKDCDLKHKSPAKYERDRVRFQKRKSRRKLEVPPRFRRLDIPTSVTSVSPPPIHAQNGNPAANVASSPDLQTRTPESKNGTVSSSACSQDVIKPPWFDGCHSRTLEILCTIEPSGPPSVPSFVPALIAASDYIAERKALSLDVDNGHCDGCLGTVKWDCLKQCTRCALAFYCSIDCQTKDFWAHRPSCDETFFA